MELEDLPKSICLRVTRRCNAACSFCQAPPTSRGELSVSEIATMAHFFAMHGVCSIKISGGEPTVRRDLPQIIEAIAKADLRPVLITNGFRMPNGVIEAAASSGAELKFSVHRPSAENDTILRRKSFTEITENMAQVVSRGVRLSINTVVTPRSVDYMRPMAEFAHAVGAGKISFIPVVSRGRAKDDSAFAFRPSDLDAVRERVAELGRALERIKIRLLDFRNHGYWIVENDGSLWIEYSAEGDDVRVCGKEHLMLTQYGDQVEGTTGDSRSGYSGRHG